MYPDLSMTLWYAGTAVVLLVDIFDIVLDFAMVGELAAKGFRDEAAWLAVMTILAFALSATIRVAGSSNAEPWEVLWFFCLAELAAFFVEDATTVMIWWRTGLYPLSPAPTTRLLESAAPSPGRSLLLRSPSDLLAFDLMLTRRERTATSLSGRVKVTPCNNLLRGFSSVPPPSDSCAIGELTDRCGLLQGSTTGTTRPHTSTLCLR